jgi:hypothetical protein
MAEQLDSVALLEAHQSRSRRDVRAHRPGVRPRATAAAQRQPAWQAVARPPPGAGRHRVEAAHRPAVAGCAHTVRAVADLLRPPAPLAAGRDLAQSVGAAGHRPGGLRRRPPRPGAGGGGASGSGARGPGGGDATTTTTAPAAHSAVSTTPARPAAAAPPRSRPGPGPSRAAVAVLRAQPPPAPTPPRSAAWARTTARNPWATIARLACRYQASQRRTW